MRLAAVFIPEGVLKYIFGENHKGYTLNLGGKYNYEYTEKNGLPIKTNQVLNTDFLDNFWGEDLLLVSALVGANGTGKSSVLNLFRNNSFCYFIYENLKSDEIEVYNNTELINDVIYYTPFLNIENHNSVNGNFKDISKYELMLEDTENESIGLSAQLELHNSENLKRWIKFRQITGIETFLRDIKLPIFDSVKIKLNYISITEHDTPNNFRPFFKKFKEIKESENNRRFEELRVSHPNRREFRVNRNFGNSIRLEFLILERVIDKVQNVLESSGNKYLNEGYIRGNKNSNSPEFTEISDLKEAFYWFIENAFIQLSEDSEKILFPVQEIKLLTDLLLVNIPKDNEIENWAELNVSLDATQDIFNAYEKFIISFKDDFSFDRKILLTFIPDKNLSSGEKGMYDLFSSLHDYQFKVEENILEEYNMYSRRKEHNNNYLLLLDEAEMGFHPQWKKRFINSILKLFPFIFPQKKIQILFTTHDPLTLSDIPKSNVIFLDRSPTSNLTYVLNETEKAKKRTFGANIHDLLADSFFLQDGFMGEFAEELIIDLVNYLTFKEEDGERGLKNIKEWDEIKAEKVIAIIDEPLIKERLQSLFYKKFRYNEKELLRLKIQELNIQLTKLENEKN
ncbi:AAA family ATPase [Mariniflexile litorale]|uniref:AAA family ATPase n=1 Tax=Mariniflexile litorale TaxID=3045158 RepID=A0AAU7ECG2_9FLAO|nr:AAA family ATPase [Mariniflexile sp. KMM 9835]MDQ8212323.1 AAA family ATPase [Mariniflexile sp. KMM 9835]